MNFKVKKAYYRLFSVFLSLVMIVISVPLMSINANATEEDFSGLWLFNNVKYNNKYIHINNVDNPGENEIIELHTYNPYWALRWYIINVGNGYYKIESILTKLVLTAPTGYNNDIVRQTTYTGANTQLWKFIKQSDGTYKISPKSNHNCYLVPGAVSTYADQDLEISFAQSDDGDKWVLLPSALECWKSGSSNVRSWAKYPTVYSNLIGTHSNFYFYSGVTLAKSQWQGALSITLNSASESASQIQCYGASLDDLAEDYGVRFSEGILGLTTSSTYPSTAKSYTWGGTTKEHRLLAGSKIYIPSQVIRNGQRVTLTSYEQYRTIIHEFGHALGYDGHSSISSDIMFASNSTSNTNYTLTENDIAHLKQFYN